MIAGSLDALDNTLDNMLPMRPCSDFFFYTSGLFRYCRLFPIPHEKSISTHKIKKSLINLWVVDSNHGLQIFLHIFKKPANQSSVDSL